MRAGRILAVGTVCLVGAAPPAPAQTRITGGGELGFARVDYDVLLASNATYASADAALTSPATTLAARATLVQFESGRLSLQGVVAGSRFIPAHGRVRIELAGAAGASTYADTVGFGHGLGRLRVHAVARSRGGWVGAALGSTSLGSGWRPASQFGVGFWSQLGAGDFTATATATSVGDTAYADVEAGVRVSVARVTLRGAIGTRSWARGTGRGAYAETSASVPLGARISIVVAAGRYPTDPIRGSIAGSQLSTGVRLTAGPLPGATAPAGGRPRAGSRGAVERSPNFEVLATSAGKRTIRIQVAGATSVEIMGDFTNWEPMTLTRSEADWWEVTCLVPPGARRLNLRVNGGAWRVPPGTTRVQDEFGADVGVIIVP